ncbi:MULTISPECIES: hypothetical protein [Nitrincola]|uniref:ABC transporter substrate-binding protein n=1 Tax=Nitrincola nitratireducens TaxID=1229521 RepID=W9UQU0_9GAMM|nr:MULTISPECIES: hypothetical protein [Nitrincola]EXJ09588.1 hypothetical protein D791_03430 [Nitrincola nitratireducens]
MKCVKHVCIGVLLSSIAAVSQSASVVTVAPITFALSESLLQSTDIETLYLPPERLPMNRIAGWLARADQASLPVADAVLTIESVVPTLSLYPVLRQSSIRTIPIDAAYELSPGGAKVSLRPEADEDFFWLDSNNLTVMVNISARDLSRVWPESAGSIEEQRRKLQREIQKMTLAVDQLLLEQDVSRLAVTDDRLLPLAMSLSLPIVERDEADLVLSLSHQESDHQMIWVVDPLIRKTDGLEGWLNDQLASLQKAIR